MSSLPYLLQPTSTTMRLAAALLLSLLLLSSSASLNIAQAEARPLRNLPYSSVSRIGSTSQAVRDLQTDNPFHKVESSFRRIPPSIPNPIQNKYKPPLGGRKNHRAADSESRVAFFLSRYKPPLGGRKNHRAADSESRRH